MTNEEKLREIFPKTIFIYRKKDDKTTAIMCSDEWLNAEYKEPTTKNDLAHNLCDSCTNIGCELQSGIVRTKCAFYMPSITPQEPKTGHWIRVDKDKLKCSECDVTHFIAQYPQGKIVWCPNCGAKMESEDK